MKIRIFINSSFESDSIGMDNNTLIFYFKSIESYKNFRNTFSLNKEFEDDLEIPIFDTCNKKSHTRSHKS